MESRVSRGTRSMSYSNMVSRNTAKVPNVISFKYGMSHVVGETEYMCYQEFGGYDLLKVKGRLAIYKKKILQRATHKENIYQLDPETFNIIFHLQRKNTKHDAKKDKNVKKGIYRGVSQQIDASQYIGASDV